MKEGENTQSSASQRAYLDKRALQREFLNELDRAASRAGPAYERDANGRAIIMKAADTVKKWWVDDPNDRAILEEAINLLRNVESIEDVGVHNEDIYAGNVNLPRRTSLLPSLILSAKTIYADMSVLLSRMRRARAVSIKQPPGSRLLKLTEFFCSPKTMKLTVNPLVADWRGEYFEALKEGREWKARWISTRYYFAFGKALSLDKVLGMLKAVSSVFTSG